MTSRRTAFAPGRVNLIGDHTDYTGGWVLPMAIDRGTTVDIVPGSDVVRLTSDAIEGEAVVPLDVQDPRSLDPSWARYVGGVVAMMKPSQGGTGTVSTTLPLGAGLSSSAAIEVAVALALGFEGSPVELALMCRDAEETASGVPCGVMDQMASAVSEAGHALLLDCTSLETSAVALPDEAEIVVVDSGQSRELAGSAYGERRRQCEEASEVIGPLRQAQPDDVDQIADVTVRRRARHVITENRRVLDFVSALSTGDLPGAGRLMNESHFSLRDDFDVSTDVLDSLTEQLRSVPGVHGARLTGAGFGGCVVVLAEKGSPVEGWRFTPGGGARVTQA